MTRQEKIDKLNQIAKPERKDSKWKAIAKWNRDHSEALDDYITIAYQISKTLKEQGKTQREMAAELGVSPQALTRIMKGRQNLSLLTIRRIEKVLGVNLISVHRVVKSQIKAECIDYSEGIGYRQGKSVYSGPISERSATERTTTKENIYKLRDAA